MPVWTSAWSVAQTSSEGATQASLVSGIGEGCTVGIMAGSIRGGITKERMYPPKGVTAETNERAGGIMADAPA